MIAQALVVPGPLRSDAKTGSVLASDAAAQAPPGTSEGGCNW